MRLMRGFEFRFEEGWDQEGFWRGIRCWQSLIKGGMMVRVESREGGAR